MACLSICHHPLSQLLLMFEDVWYVFFQVRFLLESCWEEDPSDRPSLAEVLEVSTKYAERDLAVALQVGFQI